eukprot:TRINITY_DN22_c1_g1_i1.p1 TRINITY_DN22_c1_g1~~TRINITY_DN22_c1_g1_i1.p1  ORF type:complete len:576 (+),score=103.26 TRINITY_DN22_c1_g1_i1:257-1729(+)
MVYNDGFLYLFGGIGKSTTESRGMLNDVHAFDVNRKIWTLLTTTGAPPAPRWGHSAVLVANSLPRRLSSSSSSTAQASSSSSSTASYSFTEARRPSGALMVVFGGYGASFYSDVWELNLDTLAWARRATRGTIPLPRHFHSAVAHFHRHTEERAPADGEASTDEGEGQPRRSIGRWYMYVVGGYDGTTTHPDMYRFNLENNMWQNMPSPPEAVRRRGHGAIIFQNSIYVVGGQKEKCKTNDIWECSLNNFARPTWEQILPLGEPPSPRQFHSVQIDVVRGVIWVFGGLAERNENNLYCFPLLDHGQHSSMAPSEGSLEGFRYLVNNELFSDLTLVAEDIPVPVHKAVLFGRCERFRAMLGGVMKEAAQARIDLPNIRHDVLLVVLEHIYTGAALVPAALAVDVMCAADEYILEDLRLQAEKIMCRAMDADNVVDLLMLADKHRLPLLCSRCLAFLKPGLPSVAQDKRPVLDELARSWPELATLIKGWTIS